MTTITKTLITQLQDQQDQIESVRIALLKEDEKLRQQRDRIDAIQKMTNPFNVNLKSIKDANWIASTAVHRAYAELSTQFEKIQLHIEELCHSLASDVTEQNELLHKLADSNQALIDEYEESSDDFITESLNSTDR